MMPMHFPNNLGMTGILPLGQMLCWSGDAVTSCPQWKKPLVLVIISALCGSCSSGRSNAQWVMQGTGSSSLPEKTFQWGITSKCTWWSPSLVPWLRAPHRDPPSPGLTEGFRQAVGSSVLRVICLCSFRYLGYQQVGATISLWGREGKMSLWP